VRPRTFTQAEALELERAVAVSAFDAVCEQMFSVGVGRRIPAELGAKLCPGPPGAVKWP
jgi:hypothetical protein